ncbi:MAG: hypothetical protein WC462_03050 [archaeon]
MGSLKRKLIKLKKSPERRATIQDIRAYEWLTRRKKESTIKSEQEQARKGQQIVDNLKNKLKNQRKGIRRRP